MKLLDTELFLTLVHLDQYCFQWPQKVTFASIFSHQLLGLQMLENSPGSLPMSCNWWSMGYS